MNINQAVNFITLFLEPAVLMTLSGELLAANRPAVSLLQADQDDIGGKSLSDWIDESEMPLRYYLDKCLTASAPLQPVTGSLALRIAGRNILCWCYGQTIRLAGQQNGREQELILLRFLRQNPAADTEHAGAHNLYELFQNMPHQHLLDARLQSAEAHAQAVLDTVVDAIITIDAQGIIQTFNPAAEQMFGYRAWEIIGYNVSFLMPSPHREQHDAYIHNYLTTGVKKIIGIGREIIAQRKDKSIFPIELAISEVNIAGQRRFTGVIRNISERKQAEQRLRDQEQQTQQARELLAHVNRLDTLGEMAAGIAHEVNQPLTAIASYARACSRWFEAGRSDHPRLLETLNEINEQAQQAGDIIHGLRNLVKKRENKREVCELNQLVGEVIRLAQVDARRQGIRLIVNASANPLPVLADAVQMQQVLLNLIRNAIEAMLEWPGWTGNGIITVSTRHDDDFARIEVHDQGPGLSVSARENLFNPFFTTKPAGMGMGLSICRSIVNAHSGQIGFATAAEQGTGATLFFTIPLTLDAE